MALLKTGTQTARLITINHDGKSYNIIPGGKDSEFVEVPDSALDMSFVVSLIESGDLIGKKGSLSTNSVTIDDLRNEAESLGITVDKRWKTARLQMEIDSVK